VAKGSTARCARRRFPTPKGRQHRLRPSKSAFCLSITLERDLREYQPCGVENYQDWVRVDRCFHGRGEQREHGFIAINWDYTYDQLKDEFAKWLKEKRGERKPVQSERGQNKRRQYLKALGAKRLLDAGFTAEKAMEYTERFLKDEQNDPKPLYENPRTWSDAKNRSVPSVLRELFPAPAAPPDRQQEESFLRSFRPRARCSYVRANE